MLGPIEMWGCLWCAELEWLIDGLYDPGSASWAILEEIRNKDGIPQWHDWRDARIVVKDGIGCRMSLEPCFWLRVFNMDTALMEPEDWLNETEA